MNPWIVFGGLSVAAVCVIYLWKGVLDRIINPPCPFCGGHVDFIFPVEENIRPYFKCRQCKRLV